MIEVIGTDAGAPATLPGPHLQHLRDDGPEHRHSRAIERLQNTMSGAAMSYETTFRRV